MSPPKKTVLEPLRLRIRRLQFIGGLGFLSLMVGSVLSVSLSQRLALRVQALPFEWLRLLIELGIQKLWVLGVLPVLCYGAARVVDLRPWPTAIGGMLSGQVFLLALEFVQNGIDGWVERGWLFVALDWGVLGLGVWITQRAVVRGRADVVRQAERAQQQAAARKDEYAEFLQAAERGGEKIAQREAAQAGAAVEPGGPAAPAAAVTPATAGEGATEQKPAEEGKLPST